MGQFNVRLSDELAKAIKLHALDQGMTYEQFVGQVMAEHLWGESATTVRAQPVLHVSDVESTNELLQAVGGSVTRRWPDDDAATVQLGATEVVVLGSSKNEASAQLMIETTVALQEVERAAREADVEAEVGPPQASEPAYVELHTAGQLRVRVYEGR